MARPRKDGLDYFPHDVDASNDEKIEIMTTLYGNDGYAFYFILLERIYRTPNFELSVSDAETIQILAQKTNVSVEKFMQMLNTALKYGLFDKEAYEERKVLTSNGIKKRAAIVLEKREKMRKRYRASKKISDEVSAAEMGEETNISATEIGEENGEKTPQSKEKKSKEKNNIINPTKEDKIPEQAGNDSLNFSNKDLIAELGAIYKEIKGNSLTKGEYATIGKYYNALGYDTVRMVLEKMKKRITEGGNFENPFSYLCKTFSEIKKEKDKAIALGTQADGRTVSSNASSSWHTKTITDDALEDWERTLIETTYKEVNIDV